MTKAELMEYVGKKIYVYFKDGESGIYGLLGYADDFSAKHDYRKPNYFYIGHTSFKVSHVRKVEEGENNMANIGMSKTEETNSMIEYVTKLKEKGFEVENTVFLADIAKSLAIIADRLCVAESEDKK